LEKIRWRGDKEDKRKGILGYMLTTTIAFLLKRRIGKKKKKFWNWELKEKKGHLKG